MDVGVPGLYVVVLTWIGMEAANAVPPTTATVVATLKRILFMKITLSFGFSKESVSPTE